MSVEEVIGKVKEVFGFKKEEASDVSDIRKWKGSNPHSNFEQMHPFVGKEEPAAFANPVEAGAKKPSEAQCGLAMPQPLTDDLQPGGSYTCPADAGATMGSNPHANFEQMHPAVNKIEPAAFANPCEAGAKKPSEAQMGKPMPQPRNYCQ
jgi:hypothetical protein